ARTSLRGGGGGGGCPRPPRRWGAWASQERSSTGTPIVAGRRSLTPPLARASRLSPSFILSWTPGRRAVPRRDARPAAVPYLRTLRHRTAPADGARATIVRRAAHRRFSAAGCAGSLGQTRSSTISALRAGRAHPERARSPLLRTTLLWRLPQSNWPTTEFRNWRQTNRQNSMSLLHNAAVFCLCSALSAAHNWHSESL